MIDVVLDHPHLSIPPDRLSHLLLSAARDEGAAIDDLSVILTGHETVLELNQAYLEHDFHTDVLAFDLSDEDGGPITGEIYVDLDTAFERHSEFDASFDDEAARYALHGLLHLVGYRDEDEESVQRIRALEDAYLRRYWHAV